MYTIQYFQFAVFNLPVLKPAVSTAFPKSNFLLQIKSTFFSCDTSSSSSSHLAYTNSTSVIKFSLTCCIKDPIPVRL